MILLGITGNIDSGKTTLAGFLSDIAESYEALEVSDLIIDVANELRAASINGHPRYDDIAAINAWLEPLPDILKLLLHANVTPEELLVTHERMVQFPDNFDKLEKYLSLVAGNPDYENREITFDNKDEFRPLLQWLGGYTVENCGGIWLSELIRRAELLDDTELITVGGIRYADDGVKIRQAGGLIVELIRSSIPVIDAMDPTELARQALTSDIIVENEGTIEDLRTCASELLQDLRKRMTKKLYVTTIYPDA